jgi:hypothetical protein
MKDEISHFPRMVGHGESGLVSVSPDTGEISAAAEIETRAWARQLLEVARQAAGEGAASVEQALEWLVKQREDMTVEMERWRTEARRLGSTMEAWPPE